MTTPLAPDDDQQFLLPPSLAEWVPADRPGRFLREFVEQLDLPVLGFATPACAEPAAQNLALRLPPAPPRDAQA